MKVFIFMDYIYKEQIGVECKEDYENVHYK